MMPYLYRKIDDKFIDQFEFDNTINILTSKSNSCFFVNCIKYPIKS